MVSATLAGGMNAVLADTLDVRVNASADDASQTGTTVDLSSSSLNLANDDWVGQRFTDVTVPQGSYIISAYVTLTASAHDSGKFSTSIYGESVDDSTAFTTAGSNISNRARTSAVVTWSTSGNWKSGNVVSSPDLRTVVQEIVNRSGWVSGNNLSILFQKGQDNRHVCSYDGDPSQAPLLHIEYVVVARPIANRLLFVVSSSSSPTAKETQREAFFEDIGYSVTLIADSASQAAFDTAAAANDVGYISGQVSPNTVKTKLKAKPLGVVSEEPNLSDDFAVASKNTSASTSSINIAKNNHYITSPFSTGTLTIASSSQAFNTWTGTLANDLNTLATINGAPSLVVVETNGKLNDGTTAAGRRVFFPLSHTAIDLTSLTDNGYNLLSRALAWAGGEVGYWRLDETTGTTASDSSVNNLAGTLNYFSFSTNAVSPAKVAGALSFDGSVDYISVTNNSVLQMTKALSVSAWVYGNSWGSGSNANIILRKGDSNPNNWQFGIENGYVSFGLDGNDGSNVHGNSLLDTGRWYHVVGTWDGANIRIYVDGVLDNTPTPRAAPINTDTRPVYLGGCIGIADVFDGRIDDVRLFNYALDVDEVTALNGQGQEPSIRIQKWVEIQ